ncbi:MAG: ATP-binding protein [Actinomycetota bacterium]
MTARTGPAEGRSSASLGERITQRVMSLSLVPVVVLLALLLIAAIGAVLAGTRGPDVRAAAIDAEADRARLLMNAVEGEIDERTADLSDWGRAPAVSTALRASYGDADEMADWPSTFIATRRDGTDPLDESGVSSDALTTFVDGSPFVDVFTTESNGLLVATSDSAVAFAHGEEAWWLDAWTSGQSIAAPLTNAGAELILVAVRIDDADGQPLGVAAGHLRTTGLQRLADDAATGDDLDAWVVGPTGRLLAETASGHDAGRIGQNVTFEPPLDELEQAAADGDDRAGSLGTDALIGGFGRADTDSPVAGWLVLTANGAPPSNAVPVPLVPTLVAVAVALTIAAGVCWWYLRREARAVAHEIVEPLQALRTEADRLATQELPELVSSIRTTDGSGELPAVELIEIDADGEVAELADSFNSLRLTAIDLAATQALDHSRDLATALVNLGRRNQQIIGRQLRYLEDWERTESDPDVLRQLFTVDQLATRMRRNAENLLVLAGERVPRRADGPEPIEDVIRAAASEIEDFARVELGAVEPAMVEPSLASDLTHLLAELIENAARFSPTTLPVEVLGAWSERSDYTVSVVDRGPGMSRTLLAEANARIDQTASEETATGYLGLYVVGRLAARHGLDARLVESATVGITAKVTLPERCVSIPPVIVNAGTPAMPPAAAALPSGAASAEQRPLPGTSPVPLIDADPRRADHPAAFIVRTPSTIITGEHPAIRVPNLNDLGSIDVPAPQPGTPPHLNWPPPVVPDQADQGDESTEATLLDDDGHGDGDGEPWASDHEDESDGAPIPPFQARRSRRRPTEPAALLPTTPDLDLRGPHLIESDSSEIDLTATEADLEPAVSSHPAAAGLTPASPHLALVTVDEPDPEQRAAEVRSQLSRFTEGVAAAKAIVASPTAPDAASLFAGVAGPPVPEQAEADADADTADATPPIEVDHDVAGLIEAEAMPESVVDDSDSGDDAPALDQPTAVINVVDHIEAGPVADDADPDASSDDDAGNATDDEAGATPEIAASSDDDPAPEAELSSDDVDVTSEVSAEAEPTPEPTAESTEPDTDEEPAGPEAESTEPDTETEALTETEPETAHDPEAEATSESEADPDESEATSESEAADAPQDQDNDAEPAPAGEAEGEPDGGLEAATEAASADDLEAGAEAGADEAEAQADQDDAVDVVHLNGASATNGNGAKPSANFSATTDDGQTAAAAQATP